MHFQEFAFGSIQIDAVTYEHDVVIEGGEVRKRKKEASKKYRDEFGHTPLLAEKEIPWKCRGVVIETGAYGALPVMDEVKQEARRRNVELVIVPTPRAIEELRKKSRTPMPSCT